MRVDWYLSDTTDLINDHGMDDLEIIPPIGATVSLASILLPEELELLRSDDGVHDWSGDYATVVAICLRKDEIGFWYEIDLRP